MTTPASEPAPVPGRRRWFDRRRPLPLEDAQHRITAFLYGNIIVLAALVPIGLHEVTVGDVGSVLGIAASTFLAHVFANAVTSTWSRESLRRELRDSAPILTSGVVPALLLATVLLGVPSLTAVLLSELLLVVRLALLGLLVARLHGTTAPGAAVRAGLGIALVALVIVVVKSVLTH